MTSFIASIVRGRSLPGCGDGASSAAGETLLPDGAPEVAGAAVKWIDVNRACGTNAAWDGCGSAATRVVPLCCRGADQAPLACAQVGDGPANMSGAS